MSRSSRKCARSGPCVLAAPNRSIRAIPASRRDPGLPAWVIQSCVRWSARWRRRCTRACFGRVRMSNDGEQRQVKQVSTDGASAARSEGLLPVAAAPAIVAAQRADAAQLDAAAGDRHTAGRRMRRSVRCPRARAGRSCTRASPPAPAACAPPSLANRRQTLAVLGYLDAEASPFERLALAGRMLKEAAARQPQQLGARRARAARRRRAPRWRHCWRRRSRTPSRCRASALRRTPSGTCAASRCSTADGARYAPRRGERPRHQPRALADGAAAQHAGCARLPPRHRATGAPARARPHLARRACAAPRRRQRLPRGGRGQRCRRAPASRTCATARRAGGAPRTPDVALVGKGILFDTGGVNLKPHRSMLDMHTDMAGSAVALATLIALAELRAPLAADAWLAITENRIGPHAYKPQEVVTRRQRRHHPGDPHRRRRPHGARRHPRPRRAHAAASHARLRHAHRRLRLCAHRAHERRVHQPAGTGRQARRAPAAPAASACGTSRSRPTTTPSSRARSPTSCNAPWRARAITFSRRASCRASCRRPSPWAHVDLSSATPQRRTRPREHRHHRLRRALRARAAAEAERACRAGGARREVRWRCGVPTTGTCTCATARRWRAVLPFTAARFARAIVMPNLKPAGDHDARRRSPTASASCARAARRARRSSR